MKMKAQIKNLPKNKHNNNSYNPLTSRRTDGGKNSVDMIEKEKLFRWI